MFVPGAAFNTPSWYFQNSERGYERGGEGAEWIRCECPGLGAPACHCDYNLFSFSLDGSDSDKDYNSSCYNIKDRNMLT